jgi:Zn-finger nucleic acid-binding protein
MSGNGEIDQCPFCNAVWGDCSHIQLLMALEAETSTHRATGFRACGLSKHQPDTSTEKPAAAGGTPRKLDQNKSDFGSW